MIEPFTPNTKETLYAYIAGIIDGEGYIGIKKGLPTAANKMRSPKYEARLSIAMTDREAITLIERTFGIYCCTSLRPQRNVLHKSCYHFDVTNHRVGTILRSVLPYLQIKREQALTVIAFCKLRLSSRSFRTKAIGTFQWHTSNRKSGSSYRTFGLSDDYLAECELAYQHCLSMNAKGVAACAT